MIVPLETVLEDEHIPGHYEREAWVARNSRIRIGRDRDEAVRNLWRIDQNARGWTNKPRKSGTPFYKHEEGILYIYTTLAQNHAIVPSMLTTIDILYHDAVEEQPDIEQLIDEHRILRQQKKELDKKFVDGGLTERRHREVMLTLDAQQEDIEAVLQEKRQQYFARIESEIVDVLGTTTAPNTTTTLASKAAEHNRALTRYSEALDYQESARHLVDREPIDAFILALVRGMDRLYNNLDNRPKVLGFSDTFKDLIGGDLELEDIISGDENWKGIVDEKIVYTSYKSIITLNMLYGLLNTYPKIREPSRQLQESATLIEDVAEALLQSTRYNLQGVMQRTLQNEGRRRVQSGGRTITLNTYAGRLENQIRVDKLSHRFYAPMAADPLERDEGTSNVVNTLHHLLQAPNDTVVEVLGTPRQKYRSARILDELLYRMSFKVGDAQDIQHYQTLPGFEGPDLTLRSI